MTYENSSEQLEPRIKSLIEDNHYVRAVLQDVLWSFAKYRKFGIPLSKDERDLAIDELIFKGVIKSAFTDTYFLSVTEDYKEKTKALSDAVAFAEIPPEKEQLFLDNLGETIKYCDHEGLLTIHAGKAIWLFHYTDQWGVRSVYRFDVTAERLIDVKEGVLNLDQNHPGGTTSIVYDASTDYPPLFDILNKKGLV